MQLTASDIVTLYRPTPCPLRVYLRQRGVEKSEPSEFEKSFRTLAPATRRSISHRSDPIRISPQSRSSSGFNGL